MATTEQLAMLRAMVDADFDRHKELCDVLHASGGLDGYGEVIGAAFYVAVRMQFSKRYCAEDVILLVADTRALFDLTGDILDPRSMELVVRCALGEHGLVAGLPDAAVVQAQGTVCSFLAYEHRLGDPDVFMAKVQEILDEWAADDESAALA